MVGVGDQRHADKMREAACPHLAHDIRAVDLDRAWAYSKIISDCLVRQAGDKTIEHLPLAL